MNLIIHFFASLIPFIFQINLELTSINLFENNDQFYIILFIKIITLTFLIFILSDKI